MDVIYEKIKPGGEIEIPEEIMKRLHLKVGEEVALSVTDRKLLIKPAKSIVDEITGAIEIDPKIGKRIIEDEEIEAQMFED